MRKEIDSMGEMEVDDRALYGASTQRAVLNFPISGRPLPARFIRGLALVKLACAETNGALGRLPPEKARLIAQAAREIADGAGLDQFPVDIFQTGSGTSTNMNANEVIANRVSQLAGEPVGSRRPVHPNDDVNLGQSSNDVIPTALHVSVAQALAEDLGPALRLLREALERKAVAFAPVVKIGRTHLMDALPVTLGQEFSGYAAQLAKAEHRATAATNALRELAIGGTAVGTGVNGHPEFARRVCLRLEQLTGIAFREAANHFEAQAARDDIVEASGLVATIAASLHKIASDIRLLGSGPSTGLAEIRLPATQPGSSMMPGKVNPVMCEVLIQVCLYVHGLNQTTIAAGSGGQLELNATLPLLAHTLHESIHCLANTMRVFATKCVDGIEADAARCRDLADRSAMLVTALVPHIGYDRAAALAKEAFSTGRTVAEVAREQNVMDAAGLARILDPTAMTGEPVKTPPSTDAG
jgi:fumarate hydratase class II